MVDNFISGCPEFAKTRKKKKKSWLSRDAQEVGMHHSKPNHGTTYQVVHLSVCHRCNIEFPERWCEDRPELVAENKESRSAVCEIGFSSEIRRGIHSSGGEFFLIAHLKPPNHWTKPWKVMQRSIRNFNIPPAPRKNPGFWTLENWIVHISAPSGQNGVQMPYPIIGFVCEIGPS